MIEYYDKEELELQISNYLSGNSTDEEKETLLAFLASNEAAARTFREMSAVWALSSVPSFAEIENSNLVRIKERMTAPASSKPVRKLIPVWLKVAAAVILLIGCNYFWYTYTENLTEVYTNADSPYEIKVPAGSRTNIVLPDGTEVSLNAGSVLRYHRGFGIRERNVTLDGEGYFKVAKNAEVPFFVKTNDVQVQVVGTVFNVRAYDDDNYVMVSLLEGRVNLSASANSVMKLFPNEQALYNKNTGRMEKLKTNASKACDWLDGGLTFENASFADIAHRLERKFQVKISIESERLKAEHFSGSFDSNQNIYDILHEIIQYFLMISLSFHVQFLQQEQTNAVLQHSKDYRRRRLNLSHL